MSGQASVECDLLIWIVAKAFTYQILLSFHCNELDLVDMGYAWMEIEIEHLRIDFKSGNWSLFSLLDPKVILAQMSENDFQILLRSTKFKYKYRHEGPQNESIIQTSQFLQAISEHLILSVWSPHPIPKNYHALHIGTFSPDRARHGQRKPSLRSHREALFGSPRA